MGLGFKSRPVRFSWCLFCDCGVFDRFFGGFAVVTWVAPEQQTGQTRCGRLWWSWVQLADRGFCVLVLVWFLRVSLFILVLG